MTRILLVDDHEMMRAGFRAILGSQPDLDVVGEAGTGAEALEQARLLTPDVICMDIQMPDMDGLTATGLITTDPTITAAVLILTTFDSEDYLFSALRAGAAGFLLKNSAPEDLIHAVRVLSAGEPLLSPEATRRVIERFAREESAIAAPAVSAPASPLAELEALTDREREIFAELVRGSTNPEIAVALHLGQATVKTHVSNVLTKLGLRDRVQAVIFAYEHGLQHERLLPPPPPTG